MLYSPFHGVRVHGGRSDRWRQRRRRFRFLLFPGGHGWRHLDRQPAIDHMQLDDQPGFLEAPDAIVATQFVDRTAVDAHDLVAGAQRSPGRLGAGRRAAVGARLDEQPVARVHAVEPEPEAQSFAGQTVDEHFFGGRSGDTRLGGRVRRLVVADGQHGDERIVFGRLDAAAAASATVHRHDGHKVFHGHGRRAHRCCGARLRYCCGVQQAVVVLVLPRPAGEKKKRTETGYEMCVILHL